MFVHKQAHGQRAGHALLLRYDPGFCPAAPPCAPEPALGEPVVVPVALLPEAVEGLAAFYDRFQEVAVHHIKSRAQPLVLGAPSA